MVWRYRELVAGVVLVVGAGVALFLLSDGGIRLPGGIRSESPLVAVSHSDCERPRLSGIAQPASALSSLAIVAVGLGVLAEVGRTRGSRPRKAMAGPGGASLGAVLLVLGLGSFAFHRSPTVWAGNLDAWGVTLVAIWWTAWNLHRKKEVPRPWMLFAVAAVGAAAWIVLLPDGTVVLQIFAVAYAAWSELLRPPLGRDVRLLAAAVVVGALGAAVWVASRQGGALCDPESLVQGHAVWHVLAATALALSAWYLWSELAAQRPPGLRTTPAP